TVEDDSFDVLEEAGHSIDAQLVRGGVDEIAQGSEPRGKFIALEHEVEEHRVEEETLPEGEDSGRAAGVAEGAAARVEEVGSLVAEEECDSVRLAGARLFGGAPEHFAERARNVPVDPHIERLEQEIQVFGAS